MSLLGILFGIVFVALLVKAIVETIYGSVLIAHGICCHILAAIIDLLAMIIRLFRKSRKKPEPKPLMIGDIINILYSDTPEGERMRNSFRRSA